MTNLDKNSSVEFDKLVQMHKDSVYRQLVRTCGSREDAEDALVESLIAAWQAADRLENPAAFRGWIGTIARRVCSHIRKSDRLVTVIGEEIIDQVPADADDAQKSMEYQQMKGCIHSAVEALEPGYKIVYELRELKGLSTEEVAEQLDLTVPAVKSRLHRARDAVRESLDQSVCSQQAV